ncbi:translocon-associated protein subunit delta-like [Clytia hemisphaerica]|uniref:Translocon-associated protein subunit delta n=1 Tax=Clytia hemisphaerica TaxID=252671 RepID=A0A7M5VAF7_9CNID|eukprot:TCONS_00019626-protein
MAYIKLLLGLLFAAIVSADQCTSPTVHASTYTSKSVALSVETAYLSELTVQCSEGVSTLDLYAEIEGVIVPVASIPDKEGTYQISWAKDHKKATTGKINIKVFNNEGYNAYRKAQRNEEDVSSVKALFTVTVNHPGVSREGLFVQTEFLAVVAALLLFWTANSMRNQIME